MHLDQIAIRLGEFGPYQRQKYFLMCLFSTLSAFHAVNMVFIGAEQKHHCNVPDTNMSTTANHNLSQEEIIGLFIPPGDSCHHYDVEERLSQFETAEYNLTDILVTQDNVSLVSCTSGYSYARGQYVTTITSDVSCLHASSAGFSHLSSHNMKGTTIVVG